MDKINFLGIIFNLISTAALYAAFPLIFACTRKKQIKRKGYVWSCFGVNFAIMFALKVVLTYSGSDFGSLYPYVIWTEVFYRLGIKNMENKGLMHDDKPQSTDQ